MSRIKFSKCLAVTASKSLEIAVFINASGNSNIDLIKSQKNILENGDLDDPKFSFYGIEKPVISNITYEIKKILTKKGIDYKVFTDLPDEAKKASYTKIKRYLRQYENWTPHLKSIK